MKKISLLIITLIYVNSFSQKINTFETSEEKIDYYKDIFDLECAKDKATNNRGNGNPVLYGTRNFRTILHGVAYRGGGNNYYHKTNKRNNKNPLPNDGLTNLSKLNFEAAVYLYKVNFDTAPSEMKTNDGHTLNYYQISGNEKKEMRQLLEMTYESISNPNKGPLYLHCWNGWHQSGYVSAVLLRQFCDLGPEEAVFYWKNNTDTWNNGYDRIKTAIRDFQPYDDITISSEIKEKICPCLDEMPPEIKLELSEKEKLKSTLLTKIPFANNSSEILPGALTAIDEYILLLKNNKFFNVEIGGHTSSTGSEAYNLEISNKRALMVYNYLIKEGIEPERLTYVGYGETKLLDNSNNDNAHTINRRIEFKVTAINYEIQFMKNRYEIPEINKKQLLFAVELLNANPEYNIKIEGHTDSSGDINFNLNLSNLRAKSVYDFMLKNGISSKRMSYAGYGINNPRYSNENEEGRMKNRRIEIKLDVNNEL